MNRTHFLALPTNTVFSKLNGQNFNEILIKGDSLVSGDFQYQSISDAIQIDGSCFYAKVCESKKTGKSMTMNFDCMVRDGFFEDDQVFVVWEDDDILGLIERMGKCLKSRN